MGTGEEVEVKRRVNNMSIEKRCPGFTAVASHRKDEWDHSCPLSRVCRKKPSSLFRA